MAIDKKTLLHTVLLGILAMLVSGCELLPFSGDEPAKGPAPISEELARSRSFIPIIYPDRVVELDPRTGKERVIPDEDLIVENGKVWGRYIRLGQDIKFTMSYHNHLCAPVMTTDIDTVGDSSRPVRTFAKPEDKYDDCREEDVKKAVDRIQKHQVEYQEFNQDVLEMAPAEIISPKNK